jgi:large subunit ribosomal protein L17
MRHRVGGRKLSRSKDERRRLFTGLVRDLLIHGAITTSVAKAKAVQPMIEKIITKVKTGQQSDQRLVARIITDRSIRQQLIDEVNTRFAGRTSGYTRIIKLGLRKSDATEMAQLSFVDVRVIAEVVKPEKGESAKTVKNAQEAPVKTAKPEKAQVKNRKKTLPKKK